MMPPACSWAWKVSTGVNDPPPRAVNVRIALQCAQVHKTRPIRLPSYTRRVFSSTGAVSYGPLFEEMAR